MSLNGPFRDTRRVQDAEEPARPRVRIGGFGQHRYADPARSLCAVDRRCRLAGPLRAGSTCMSAARRRPRPHVALGRPSSGAAQESQMGPTAVMPRCRSCATSRRVVFLFEMQMTASAPVSRHTR
jgi:hypothetical protein